MVLVNDPPTRLKTTESLLAVIREPSLKARDKGGMGFATGTCQPHDL